MINKNCVVIYTRVSTKEQVQNLSLETQAKICRDYAHRSGFEVKEVFVDAGESAKTIDRPEFQAMLSYCQMNKKQMAAVIVYKVDRFGRNTEQHMVVRGLLG